jgi:hypothetical protein
MANVTLTPQQMAASGTTPTRTGSLSVSDTYLVRNDGHTFLHFRKSGAGGCTVTIQTPPTIGGLAVAEQTVNVPATTGDVMVGPFPPAIYNDGNGDAKFTLSEITGLDVAVLKL